MCVFPRMPPWNHGDIDCSVGGVRMQFHSGWDGPLPYFSHKNDALMCLCQLFGSRARQDDAAAGNGQWVFARNGCHSRRELVRRIADSTHNPWPCVRHIADLIYNPCPAQQCIQALGCKCYKDNCGLLYLTLLTGLARASAY